MKRFLLSIAVAMALAAVPASANTPFEFSSVLSPADFAVSQSGIFSVLGALLPANTATFLLGTALVGLAITLRKRSRSRRPSR